MDMSGASDNYGSLDLDHLLADFETIDDAESIGFQSIGSKRDDSKFIVFLKLYK